METMMRSTMTVGLLVWTVACGTPRGGSQFGDPGNQSGCDELATTLLDDLAESAEGMGYSSAEAEAAWLGDWRGVLEIEGEADQDVALGLRSVGAVEWVERALPEIEEGNDVAGIEGGEAQCADYYRFEVDLTLVAAGALDEAWSAVEVRLYPQDTGARLTVADTFASLQGGLQPPDGAGADPGFELHLSGFGDRWSGTMLWTPDTTDEPAEGEPYVEEAFQPFGTLSLSRTD